MKAVLKTLLILTLIFSFYSFIKKEKPEEGFNFKSFENSFVLIPKGSLLPANPGKEIAEADLSKFSQEVIIMPFYLCNHEVSNGEYLSFLNDLQKSNAGSYTKMLPDTIVWERSLTHNKPFVNYYFRHPAYKDYPVVGVNYEQAMEYCKWLTEKYAQQKKSKYKNVSFGLPLLEQWMYAAQGGRVHSVFPWNGPFMRNSKGARMASFNEIRQSDIKRLESDLLDEKGISENEKMLIVKTENSPGSGSITVPVISFWPNAFGLYNMAGNVEEMISQKGITKGGSWNDPGYYLQNFVQEKYDESNSTSSERGFRVMMQKNESLSQAGNTN